MSSVNRREVYPQVGRLEQLGQKQYSRTSIITIAVLQIMPLDQVDRTLPALSCQAFLPPHLLCRSAGRCQVSAT